MWKIPLFDLNFDEAERLAVLDVLEKGWISMGPQTKAFEERFAELIGARSSVAMSSCTAALHTALLISGIGAGDEVIVPALTFVADVNTVILTGAKPVLADCVSLTDWNIDPDDIESKITDRTKAVIAMHYGGHPCDMKRLQEICDAHSLTLIEDAAHAPGAAQGGKSCGTFGRFGCFSLFANKNMTTAEGGILVCRDAEDDEQARLFRCHGMTRLSIDQHAGSSFGYDVAMSGHNYRMDDLRAAIGLAQLEKLTGANEIRGKLAAQYRSILKDETVLFMPFVESNPEDDPVEHVFPILLNKNASRSAFMEYLKQCGIQTSMHYPSPRSFTRYADYFQESTPIADDISNRVVTLPLFPGMGPEGVRTVCDETLAFLKGSVA